MAERVTFTISGPDGEEDIELPSGLVDLLSEEDDESQAQVVGDITTMAFASRAHMIASHGEGETSDEVADIESEAMDLFEERFGMTYGEATGHSH